MNKLEHKDVHAIRVWLKTVKSTRWMDCPFDDRCEVCYTIFPKLVSKQEAQSSTPTNPSLKGLMPIGCPCYLYSKSYVTRRARLILARHGRV